MKNILFVLMLFCANFSFAQETEEEFLPIIVEDKEAFMSTKTGEYVFRSHADTNPEELRTTASGVVYNDISIHKVVKGETLSSIAKKHKLDLNQLKTDNKLTSSKLSLGQELKIINRVLVPSSSPVISYVGEERIIAKLRPGQSPSTLAPPPPDAMPTQVEAPQKTTSPDAKKPVSRTSTYYKPMIVPNANDTIEEEEESEEVIAARKQLEEAQKKLELAKQKAIKKEAVKKEIETKEAENLEATSTEQSIIKDVSELNSDSTNKNPVEGVDYHIIKEGDNLYNLAKKYNTTVEKLTQLNEVKFNNLKIGQKLILK
ncbi:LysM peptidoglycan-binding domain-containing protein [Olleya aquimaris]|uniref:Peptidoglycan endopeptidase LytF n=1 Tax=Olleya aquimaris TaxID=639310 RepID=A0A327RGZ1_9FLAO|nr:LysM peptidoglycan-binding domain-containing protein [Olleya aquimaris]RAJ16300.1 peptidoglycan endopeptidase LytF [Olleya aquimaris]